MNNPISKALEPLGRLIAVVSGYVLLGLAFAMSVEIVGRKLFAFSFQGIDDIGGYVLAIIAVAGAGCGVITKIYVRIDIFLVRLPKGLQRFLNMLAMIAMAGSHQMLKYPYYQSHLGYHLLSVTRSLLKKSDYLLQMLLYHKHFCNYNYYYLHY